MAKPLYKNTTEFSKQFYKNVAGYNFMHNRMSSIGSLVIAYFLFSASDKITTDTNSLLGWIYVGLALVVIPIIFFVVPYLLTSRGYKKDLENGIVTTVTTEIYEDCIVCKNNRNVSKRYTYDQMSYVRKNNNMISILIKDINQPLFMNKDSFIDCTWQEAYEFLSEKINY